MSNDPRKPAPKSFLEAMDQDEAEYQRSLRENRDSESAIERMFFCRFEDRANPSPETLTEFD